MAQHTLKRRRPGSRTPKDRILIYTEGAVTEPEYLTFVNRKLGIPKELVTVRKAKHTHADGIIDEIIDAKKKNRTDSKRGRDVLVDQWWAVLDTEGQPHTLSNAIKKANDNNIYLVLSDPSFEFWLRLHFGYTTKQYGSVSALIRELRDKNYLPTYTVDNKHPDMHVLYPLLPSAMINARQLRHDHSKQGNGQPRTDCDLLLDAISVVAKDGLVIFDTRPFDPSELSTHYL